MTTDSHPTRSDPPAARIGPEVPDHQVRIIADDLARIELAHRVEGVLDLAEDLDQLAVLPAKELGAHQAAGLGAGDRPALLEDDVVDAAAASGSSFARSPGSDRSRKGRSRSRPSPA